MGNSIEHGKDEGEYWTVSNIFLNQCRFSNQFILGSPLTLMQHDTVV